MKRFTYKCRKQVAEKRLRIKGRFVTKDQAFEILGLTQSELLDNIKLQELLTLHSEKQISLNSLVETGAIKGHELIKVRNFQALLDDKAYKLTLNQ